MLKITSLLGFLLLLTISFGAPSALAVNRALSLDGNNDYVVIPMSLGSTVTIEAWATKTPGSKDVMLWCIDHDNKGPDLFFGTSGSGLIALNTWDSWKNSFCNVPSNANEWHHYAVVIAPSNTVLYIDGALCGTAAYRNPAGTSFYISSGVTYDWNGLIDEVRIWNIALPQEDIQATMEKKLRGNEPALVGYWNFDDGTAGDLSQYGNNGTLHGNAHIVESDLIFSPNITSIAPNFGPVSGGTQVVIKGDGFQEGVTVSIDGSELVDVTVVPEVAASVTAQSIDITDAAPDDVTLSITLKEKFTPEVSGAITFPTDSKVVADMLVLKTFIETGLASSPELAGKIIVTVNEDPNNNVNLLFMTLDKGTGVQLSIEQTSGSDVLFETVVSDEGHAEIIGTTSPKILGLYDVFVTNPDGGSDTFVRGFAYTRVCDLSPIITNTLAVTGTVYRETGEVAENGLPVEVKIITQGLTEKDVTGKTAGDGQYAVTFFDSEKPVAKVGDEILVTVTDTEGKLVGQSRHTLTAAEVEAKMTVIDVTPFKTYDVKRVTLTLRRGINLISLPVKVDQEWRMSDFAKQIGKDSLSMIIRYDYTQGKFISYLPIFPDDSAANAVVNPGEGYIVVMKGDKEVEFEGTTSEKIPSDDDIVAPPLTSMLLSSSEQSASIFAITGNIRQAETGAGLNEVSVMIRNLRTGQMVENVSGTLAGDGTYVATFVASAEAFITRAGDGLEITAIDKDSRFVTTPVTYTLTPGNISDYVLIMPLRLSLPQQSFLLPNYPNPFNPETWLPYQLAQNSDITIGIYNLKGQLVRTLRLGNQSAGVYVTKDRAAYWDGRDGCGEKVASGVYYYTLHTREFSATRKMVILK